MLKKLINYSLLLLLLFIMVATVRADRMGSTNYEFLFTNLNSGGTTTSSSNYTLDISLGQTAAKRWEENGYIVRAGFQYIHKLYPFTFTLSDTTLDFDTLLPNTPTTRSLTALISHRGQGYEVKVYEDHKLQTFDGGAWINDTLCNNDPACTSTQAELWDDDSDYGFGYNVTGHDVAPDFLGTNHYRPFSTSPVTFMSSNTLALARQSLIKAKINIDGAQAAGTYQTILRFIAVPKY